MRFRSDISLLSFTASVLSFTRLLKQCARDVYQHAHGVFSLKTRGTQQSRTCQHQSFQLQSHRFFASPLQGHRLFLYQGLCTPSFLYYTSLAVRRVLLRPYLPLYPSLIFNPSFFDSSSPSLLQLSLRVAKVSSKNSPKRRLSSTISVLHCHKVKPIGLITSFS